MNLSAKLEVQGQAAVAESLKLFQKEFARKDIMDGVRLGAAFCAKSLAARTKQPHGTGAHPKIAVARKADIEAIKPYIHNNKGIPEEKWQAYIKSRHGKVFVAKSDHKGRVANLRYVCWWNRSEYTKPTLNKKLRYKHIGMAKQSWLWAEKKSSKRGTSARVDNKNKSIVERQMSVRADPVGKCIYISNRLDYIRNALESHGAIRQALTAAAKRIKGYVESMVGKRAKKAGLK